MIHKDFFSIISLPLTGIPNMQRKCKNSEYYPNNDKPLCYLPKCFHISISFLLCGFPDQSGTETEKISVLEPVGDRVETAG